MGESDQGEIGPEQGGVFGNLPRSRPGTRSPRRESASRRRPAAGEPPPEPSPEPPLEPAARPEAEPTPPPVHAEAAGDDRESEPDRDAEADRDGNGLEDLAWAGVAAAAEAATIGVRLASRAMEALRDSVERR